MSIIPTTGEDWAAMIKKTTIENGQIQGLPREIITQSGKVLKLIDTRPEGIMLEDMARAEEVLLVGIGQKEKPGEAGPEVKGILLGQKTPQTYLVWEDAVGGKKSGYVENQANTGLDFREVRTSFDLDMIEPGTQTSGKYPVAIIEDDVTRKAVKIGDRLQFEVGGLSVNDAKEIKKYVGPRMLPEKAYKFMDLPQPKNIWQPKVTLAAVYFPAASIPQPQR